MCSITLLWFHVIPSMLYVHNMVTNENDTASTNIGARYAAVCWTRTKGGPTYLPGTSRAGFTCGGWLPYFNTASTFCSFMVAQFFSPCEKATCFAWTYIWMLCFPHVRFRELNKNILPFCGAQRTSIWSTQNGGFFVKSKKGCKLNKWL